MVVGGADTAANGYMSSLPYVAVWIFMSSATILFNKWVLASTDFKFPMALSAWHMLFATIVTHTLARTTTVVTPPQINRDFYMKRVVPIGLAFGVSLITSNSAYMYLSVAFIQMVKACTPMVVLLLSFGAGLEKPSLALFGFVSVVCVGVMIASAGELSFNMTGFVLQVIAVVVEASRLVLVQILVSGSVKVDALGSLYLYAPTSFLCTFVGFLIFELPQFSFAALASVTPQFLILNAATAFCLNLAAVNLVKHTSSLVLTLSGVVKDILLVILSILLHGAIVTGTQWTGFIISTFGIFMFNMYKKHHAEFLTIVSSLQRGFALRIIVAAAIIFFIVMGVNGSLSGNNVIETAN